MTLPMAGRMTLPIAEGARTAQLVAKEYDLRRQGGVNELDWQLPAMQVVALGLFSGLT
jgi:hypothetical protein